MRPYLCSSINYLRRYFKTLFNLFHGALQDLSIFVLRHPPTPKKDPLRLAEHVEVVTVRFLRLLQKLLQQFMYTPFPRCILTLGCFAHPDWTGWSFIVRASLPLDHTVYYPTVMWGCTNITVARLWIGHFSPDATNTTPRQSLVTVSGCIFVFSVNETTTFPHIPPKSLRVVLNSFVSWNLRYYFIHSSRI